MALRKMLSRLTTAPGEEDDAKLREFCAAYPGVTAIAEARPREDMRVVGEISSVRIVPQRDGLPWLEATIRDGTGAVVALWTGRRRIPGINAGQRIVVSGRGAPTGPGGRLQLYNPAYELLPR